MNNHSPSHSADLAFSTESEGSSEPDQEPAVVPIKMIAASDAQLIVVRAEVAREVGKVATRSQQHVEKRLQEVERHFQATLVPNCTKGAALPPEFAQKLAQMGEQMGRFEKQLGKEREEFAKALKRQLNPTGRSFAARITQLEGLLVKGAGIANPQALPPRVISDQDPRGGGGKPQGAETALSSSMIVGPTIPHLDM